MTVTGHALGVSLRLTEAAERLFAELVEAGGADLGHSAPVTVVSAVPAARRAAARSGASGNAVSGATVDVG